jgi:branched-subunit amino acid transport protein
MSGWIAILIVGLGSYAFRWGGLNALGQAATPLWLERVLSHLTSAALGAIVASAMFAETRAGGLTIRAEQVAIVAALVVVRKTGNIVHAVAVGLPIVWVGLVV